MGFIFIFSFLFFSFLFFSFLFCVGKREGGRKGVVVLSFCFSSCSIDSELLLKKLYHRETHVLLYT